MTAVTTRKPTDRKKESSHRPGLQASSPKGLALALAATSLLMGLAITLVFFWVPEAKGLGLDFKIFFFHVPAAWIMLLSAIVAGTASGRSLLWDRPDHLAAAATDLTVLFGVIVLVTGPLWAWRAWGKPWVWEPRLTTSLVCWLTYAVALVVRAAGPQGRKTALLLALLGAFEVPLVYLSVRWWAGGHHPPTSLVPTLTGRFAATLLLCLVAATSLWGLLLSLVLRQRRLQGRMIRLEALVRTLGSTALGLALFAGLPTGAMAGPTGQAISRAGNKTSAESTARMSGEAKVQAPRRGNDPGFVPYPEARTKTARGLSRATIGAVVAAYLAFWAILFFYLFSLARKNRSLEERLEAMERRFGPDAPHQGDPNTTGSPSRKGDAAP